MQVIVIIYALHNIVGLWPALAGLTTTILLVPLNTITGKIVHRLRKELIAKTDVRVKIMTEIINGICASTICPVHCMHAIFRNENC